jgi:hypothetical protein
MNIQDIPATATPINLSEAVNAIIYSQSYTGQQILRSMAERQVLSLWQFGLVEAELLSQHNVDVGKQPVKYPHLWVRTNLFKLIYERWLLQEQEANTLLKKLDGIRSELPQSSPASKSTIPRLKPNVAPELPAEEIHSWEKLYERKKAQVKSGDKESYCVMPPMEKPALRTHG